MQGYLEYLDTVNFDFRENAHGELGRKVELAKVKLVLYSVFYRISLSPNQVLDSLPLRKRLYNSQELLSLPFSFHLDHRLVAQPRPFEKQLLHLLRRGGTEAFIFSSIPYGKEKAITWGEFVRSAREISDADLLLEASRPHFYEEITEWTKLLDRDVRSMFVQDFRIDTDYGDIFADYWSLFGPAESEGQLTKATNRSQAFQFIQEQLPEEVRKRKKIPNLIANIQYSMGTRSKLILEESSTIGADSDGGLTRDCARVIINVEGLLKKFPRVRQTIDDASYSAIARARHRAASHIEQGWASIENTRQARKLFARGLQEFLRDLGESTVTTQDLIDVELGYSPPSPTSPQGEFSARVPVIRFLTGLFQRGFRGIEKFISIEH